MKSRPSRTGTCGVLARPRAPSAARPPLLALIGIAGAAATVATFVFAGAVFALVVAGAAAIAVWRRRTVRRAASCSTTVGSGTDPVDVQLMTTPPQDIRR